MGFLFRRSESCQCSHDGHNEHRLKETAGNPIVEATPPECPTRGKLTLGGVPTGTALASHPTLSKCHRLIGWYGKVHAMPRYNETQGSSKPLPCCPTSVAGQLQNNSTICGVEIPAAITNRQTPLRGGGGGGEESKRQAPSHERVKP